MKNLSRVVPCAIILLSALPGTADAFETGNAVFTQSSTSCGFFSGNGSFGSSLLLGSYTSNNVTYYYLTTTFSGANIPTTNVVFTFNTSNNTYTVNIPPSFGVLSGSYTGSITINGFAVYTVNITLSCGSTLTGTTQFIGG